MSKLKIASVGLQIPEIEMLSFDSMSSLSDYDIVIFSPNIQKNKYGIDRNNFCSDHRDLNKYLEHWKKELKDATCCKKCIVYIISKEEIITYGYPNGKTSNHSVFPFKNFSTRESVGTSYSLSKNELSKSIQSFYTAILKITKYTSIIEKLPDDFHPLLQTKDRKTVGAFKIHENCLQIIWPTLKNFPQPYSGQDWEPKDKQMAREIIDSLNVLYKHIEPERDEPIPIWVTTNQEYQSVTEKKLYAQIHSKNQEKDNIQREIDSHLLDLSKENALKSLLFAKGKKLEEAVHLALNILGAKTNTFENSNIEIDCIIFHDNKIAIGECEGKDGKEIQLSKARQLSDCVFLYQEKENLEITPKGILFGNPERLLELNLRKHTFSPQCTNSSEKHDMALVLTSDLFKIVSYVKDSGNKTYAKNCLDIMFTKSGKINFPDLPTVNTNSESASK